MKRILYFDCYSGISGDMTIGALLDLAKCEERFLAELEKLSCDEFEIDIKKGEKRGITGTDFNVKIADNIKTKHRHLRHIEELIDSSALSGRVKSLSKKIFLEVAKAEAKVHGKEIEAVHFHEVGAVDSIVDIVGTAILIDILDVDEIYSSPLHIGRGFVNCAHGKIPVPCPATVEILKDVPVYSEGIESELVTPTGAAIIKTLAKEFTKMPNINLKNCGYGLGTKDLEIPNMLRIFLI